MLNIGRKPLYLGILALLQLVGICLFCKGFFPYKIYLSGHATQDDVPALLKDLHNEAEFDRLVFVVIDALRNDFILGNDSGFDFINSQIQRGAASAFTARATAPTVTMPRIKAMTTGTIPSFLDAILNIAESDTSSSLDFHDNWVHQFKSNNKTIHFFGDDTWMRLFPGVFDKTDGTTSFLVSDTVEVDLNVTRHIKTDLVEMDWDAVILHYLGLDHIGHLGGPKSPLMKPKQREMDEAIESIYEIISKQDADRMVHDSKAKGTLMVVCGDHGMNEKGNHGGSSIGETSAALVFLSPRFESRPSIKTSPRLEGKDVVMGHPIIDQIDIVPTLATLFGFPIPKNNLGKVISNLSGTSDVKSMLHGLGLNAYQLAQLLSRLFPEVSRFIEDVNLKEEDDSPGRYYAEAIRSHQQFLETGTEGKETMEAYKKLYPVGLCMAQLVFVRIGFSWGHIQAWMLSYPAAQWHLMALSLTVSVVGGLKAMKELKGRQMIDIQGESTTMAAQASEVFFYKELLNWELVRDLDQVQLGKLIFNYQGAGIFVLCGLFYVTKRASLLTMGESRPEKKTGVFLQLLLHLSTPIWILLSECQHAFLFVIFYLQLLVLLQWQKYLACKKIGIPVWLISMLVSGMSQGGFYLTGHTNSIATIDLSNAYVGVQEYDTLLIGVLTFCSNWACSIWWCMAGWVLIENEEEPEQEQEKQTKEEEEDSRWISYMVTQSSLFSLVLGFLSISVTILREHLFIWTVFSPKYLYQIAWTVLYHWVVQVCLGSIFTQVLFKWNNFTEEIDVVDDY
ncbi:alkaline-phosphatase-like protein [Mucor mucedo]|uniref:alkaline-phosphatase-like protein n=1 Tax=Mucor mucedo TaxID=29922 RepID=UPI002220BC2F|nr:alkaline-phosphatase-like protein [Mucor mucedo]KAI7895809.1 alkaline-phosphatase-like protein [Mucor mucedo]